MRLRDIYDSLAHHSGETITPTDHVRQEREIDWEDHDEAASYIVASFDAAKRAGYIGIPTLKD